MIRAKRFHQHKSKTNPSFQQGCPPNYLSSIFWFHKRGDVIIYDVKLTGEMSLHCDVLIDDVRLVSKKVSNVTFVT